MMDLAKQSVSPILEALQKPLKFLLPEPLKKIVNVKNLGAHMVHTCVQALEQPATDIEKNILLNVKTLFSGFDEKTLPDKQHVLTQAFEMLGLSFEKAASKPKRKQFFIEDHPVHSLDRLKNVAKDLNQKVQYIKGIGPKVAVKLGAVGIETLEDLLKFLPRRYEDRTKLTPMKEAVPGTRVMMRGVIERSGVVFYKGLRKRVFEIKISDGTATIMLKWFQFYFSAFEEKYKPGVELLIFGQVHDYKGRMEMHHPDIEVIKGEIDAFTLGRIIPVYPEIKGLHPKLIRKWISQAYAQFGSQCICMLPSEICEKMDFAPPWKVLQQLHHPSKLIHEFEIEESQRFFAFEELFFYCLGLQLKKRNTLKKTGISFALGGQKFTQLKTQLPFELTQGQNRVLESILKDMHAPHPMNRLLQGDVGSGKTVVSLLACMVAIDEGYQVAFMAPTEVLAEQHAKTFSSLLSLLDVKVDLLLGKHSKKQKEDILQKVKSGETQLLLGTHSILELGVHFQNLGLVIVDEQHRFGVRQRSVLREKGGEPDVLVMSATPIPRTLALTMYGDLDVSILSELPKGRKPVVTRMLKDAERLKMYEKVREVVGKGQQVFIVYPLIAPSEKLELKSATEMFEVMKSEIFPHFKLGLLHGQLKALEKAALMDEFKDKKIDVLISTTVIEVGIDVPNATLMVIEQPERFGLSQLHQLRGRVGRGEAAAMCLLMLPKALSNMAFERMLAFTRIHDGFELAEEDLKRRGPGDFFGFEQSGFPAFSQAQFPRDMDILEHARQEVALLLEKDPELKDKGHAHLTYLLGEVWKHKTRLIEIG